jgi:holo-[acyl-carrier protein] synthase
LVLPFLREVGETQAFSGALEISAEIKGVGIDILPIPRITRLIERYDRYTLMLVFTPGEIDRCQSSHHCDRDFAICFAAKEAVGKALGTGLAGIDWNEIESILTQDHLTVELNGEAGIQTQEKGIQIWQAAWCEWDEHVLVHVLAL